MILDRPSLFSAFRAHHNRLFALAGHSDDDGQDYYHTAGDRVEKENDHTNQEHQGTEQTYRGDHALFLFCDQATLQAGQAVRMSAFIRWLYGILC